MNYAVNIYQNGKICKKKLNFFVIPRGDKLETHKCSHRHKPNKFSIPPYAKYCISLAFAIVQIYIYNTNGFSVNSHNLRDKAL